MAFVFEMEYAAPHGYIARFVEALAAESGVEVSVLQSGGKVTVVADPSDEKLAPFLEKLGEQLPASLFMGASSHRVDASPVPAIRKREETALPHAVGLCPRCMKEMFDPASRRYYYPFTGCGCCGAHYPFFEHYPFVREHTPMRFFTPCEACREELESNPFRRAYPLVSCHACGVPVRMRDGAKERFANDAGSFKKMFEVAAKAVADGRTVRIKTLFGERLFYDPSRVKREGEKVMLLCDGGKLERLCAVIREEKHALMSIERPMLHVAVADEALQEIYGRVTRLKYPDEGFTILLAAELLKLGYDQIAYEMCDGNEAADYRIDFDLVIEPQRESRLFINKSTRFFVEGERAIFPVRFDRRSDRIVAAHGMALVPEKEGITIDRLEKFESAEASALYLLEGDETELAHSQTVRFDQAEASVMSVLVEHGRERESAIGVYFDAEPTFIYHNGKKPIVAVPPMRFASGELRERIAGLREGSDRLVRNFETKYPALAEKLFGTPGVGDIFEAAAVIMELPGGGFDAVGLEAMKFGGKGGVQVDTKVEGNRFDPYAFVASLMSYKMAGVEPVLMAYSIFESFGDYVVEIASQLKVKAKAEHILLCGRAFGHPSLFSRVQKKFGHQPFLMNRILPIDRENALLGALAL
jgi:hypothetical protein